MRRKLTAVSADLRRRRQAQAQARKSSTPSVLLLPLSPPQPPPNGRTRLQSARADALAAGREPPTRLPAPPPIYTPEAWKDKDKRRGAGARGHRRAGTAPGQLSRGIKTVAQARRHVARLVEELEAARLRLLYLERMEGQETGREEEELDGEDEDDEDSSSSSSSSSHLGKTIAARDLPNTLDKKASASVSTQGSSDLAWSLGAVAPALDQEISNPGPSDAPVVARQRGAEDKGRQGAGTNEHDKEQANKIQNDEVDGRGHWIEKSSKTVALTKASFGANPDPDPDPDSDSDSETTRKMDELSTYLKDKYGGSHI